MRASVCLLGVLVAGACKKEEGYFESYEVYRKAQQNAVDKERALYQRFAEMRAKLTDAVPPCTGAAKADGYLRISSFKLKTLLGEASYWAAGESDPQPNARGAWDAKELWDLPPLRVPTSPPLGSAEPPKEHVESTGARVAAAASAARNAPGFVVQTVDKYVPIKMHTAPGWEGRFTGGNVSGRVFIVDSSAQKDTPRCSYEYEAQLTGLIQTHGSIKVSLDLELSRVVGEAVKAKLAGE